MKNSDIRWLQRYDYFEKALDNLAEAIELNAKRELTKLEEQGLIKGFELVHELSWLTIKDFYENLGETGIQGSKDAFRLAYKRGVIKNGDVFMRSVKSRRLSVHCYDEETIREIRSDIIEDYHGAFENLRASLRHEKEKRNL